MFPTCRVQHSWPATSVSTLSSSFLSHVASPDISILHTAEPTRSATEPHPCRRPEGRAEPNPRLLWWNPVSATTPAHHDQKQHTGEDSTPHVPGTGKRNGVPGTGTFLRAFGCHGYLPGYDSSVACTTGPRPPHPGSRGVFRFVFLSNMCMYSVNIRFLRLLCHVRCRGVYGENDWRYLQLSPWPVRAVGP